MIGNTDIVARPSRQSRRSRITEAPTSESTFWSVVVMPSVTSCCSASTSFVRREISTPARVRS
jgi:hypothetical protein